MGVFGRPVYNASQMIKVDYGMTLIQILDVDEKNQVLTTNVWSRYTWNDILLAWDPYEFGGLDAVRIPVAKIWTPDIVLYNYADTRLKEQREAMVVVSHNGTVLWIPPAIFKSTCDIDITNFPFDEQTCHMKFGSWTYDGDHLDISFFDDRSEVDTGDYIASNEWELIDHPAVRNVRYYPCCGDRPFPDLTFTLRIRRMAVFYNYILILPCVLLSFLTPVVFWLPPESPAKTMLGMHVFVAFFVLLILLADNSPPVATAIPLMGAYFCMNMTLITLSSFLAVVVIHAHIRIDRRKPVPQWLRKVTINGIGKAMCMSECVNHVISATAAAEMVAVRRHPSSVNHRPSLSRRTTMSISSQPRPAGAPSSTSSSNVAFSSSSASATVASRSAAARVSNCSNVDSSTANPVQCANIGYGGQDERLGGSDEEAKDDREKPWWRQCDAQTCRRDSVRSPWCPRREQRVEESTDDASGDVCDKQPTRNNVGNGGMHVWSSTGCRSSDWNYSTSTLIDFHHHRHLVSQPVPPPLEHTTKPRTRHRAPAPAATAAITTSTMPSASLVNRTSGRRSFTSHQRTVANGVSMATLYGSTPSFPPRDVGSASERIHSDVDGVPPPESCLCSTCVTATAAVGAAAVGSSNEANVVLDGRDATNDDYSDDLKLFSRKLTDDVHEIRRLLRSYSSRLEDRDAREQVLAEWRLVARVLDRVFFFVYCAAVIISMATVFPRAAS